MSQHVGMLQLDPGGWYALCPLLPGKEQRAQVKNLGVSLCPLVFSMSHYGHQSPVMASALAHSSCFFQMLENPNISSVCVWSIPEPQTCGQEDLIPAQQGFRS